MSYIKIYCLLIFAISPSFASQHTVPAKARQVFCSCSSSFIKRQIQSQAIVSCCFGCCNCCAIKCLVKKRKSASFCCSCCANRRLSSCFHVKVCCEPLAFFVIIS